MNNIFAYRLNKLLLKNKSDEIYIYCIGSNNTTGDALGPLVGSILKKCIISRKINIIGDYNNPLTYKKMLELNIVKKTNIYIDSALGNLLDIGKIIVNKKQIIPGKALNKQYITLKSGISIKAIVGENKQNSILNIMELNKISYEYIKDFAYFLSENIYKTIKNFE